MPAVPPKIAITLEKIIQDWIDHPLRRIHGVGEFARTIGTDYSELKLLLYRKNKPLYKRIEIEKKSGGVRIIFKPNKRLGELQRVLLQLLEKEYRPRAAAHGFIQKKSIVSNAKPHSDKHTILRVDLKDFFPSIHFGRVKRLFMAPPFDVPPKVATVLAQFCCYEGALPQGAPTSPMISNMLCSRLDRDLTRLAQSHRATYTRYADDITFSFSRSIDRLPSDLVMLHGGVAEAGVELRKVIEREGFTINEKKTKVLSKSVRQTVTGLVVNEFVNVPRPFINNTRSLLHAWQKFGHEKAAEEYYKNYKKHRASGKPPPLREIIRGQLLYIRMVRGATDIPYNKLATWYNEIIQKEKEGGSLLPARRSTDLEQLHRSLWVLESDAGQGTVTAVEGIGFITCAHVISETRDASNLFANIEVFHPSSPDDSYSVQVTHIDRDRDLAVLALLDKTGNQMFPPTVLKFGQVPLGFPKAAYLCGYPAYKRPGQKRPDVHPTSVLNQVPKWGRNYLVIGNQIRKGNSGGVVVSESFEVLGIAMEGVYKTANADSENMGDNLALLPDDVLASIKGVNNPTR